MKWEYRLGIIVPSWNAVMEHEFQGMAGGAFSIHSQRIRHTDDSEVSLHWLSTQAQAAAELLAHVKPHAICHGCTASGFLKTPADDLAQADEIAALTRVPTTTSSSSIVRALQALAARRISVASPYEPWLNEHVARYLGQAGFDVVAIKGLSTQQHGAVSTAAVRALALEVVRDDTEAIFISCSNLQTLEIITELEERTGRPVVTSNQAAMWGTLRSIGDARYIPQAGRLFHQRQLTS